MKLIAIGDIHGCSRTLDRLLDELAPGSDDHLVFLGDYVDRGPDTPGVIDRLISLQSTHTCKFLRGNHDSAMLAWIDGAQDFNWLYYGGTETVKSYADSDGTMQVPDRHLEFLRGTQLYVDCSEYCFVHAGLRPELTVAENLSAADEDVYMNFRDHLTAVDFQWEKRVIFGHTPLPEPLVTPFMIGIDTGCVYPHRNGMGRLTAVCLPDEEFITVGNCEPAATFVP